MTSKTILIIGLSALAILGLLAWLVWDAFKGLFLWFGWLP
jgi:hypothetical protein